MGGGKDGYLGMFLTPAEYCRITHTDPFTQPKNLGVLVPNPAGTASQIASVEDTHRLTKYIYLENLLLERTFIQKIIKAIDTKYLSALFNTITRKLHHSSRPFLSSCTTTMDASFCNNLTTRQPPSSQ